MVHELGRRHHPSAHTGVLMGLRTPGTSSDGGVIAQHPRSITDTRWVHKIASVGEAIQDLRFLPVLCLTRKRRPSRGDLWGRSPDREVPHIGTVQYIRVYTVP